MRARSEEWRSERVDWELRGLTRPSTDNEEVTAENVSAAFGGLQPRCVPAGRGGCCQGTRFFQSGEGQRPGRESLYKALAPGAKIRYDTVRKLLDSLGVRLTVTTP